MGMHVVSAEFIDKNTKLVYSIGDVCEVDAKRAAELQKLGFLGGVVKENRTDKGEAMNVNDSSKGEEIPPASTI